MKRSLEKSQASTSETGSWRLSEPWRVQGRTWEGCWGKSCSSSTCFPSAEPGRRDFALGLLLNLDLSLSEMMVEKSEMLEETIPASHKRQILSQHNLGDLG